MKTDTTHKIPTPTKSGASSEIEILPRDTQLINSSSKSARFVTVNGYPLDEVVSALQKEIRRSKEVEALFWANELIDSGYCKYLFRRLFIICSEDCSPTETHLPPLLWSLYRMTETLVKDTTGGTWQTPEKMCATHAVLLLARAKKNRIVDDLHNVIAGKREQGWRLEVPKYAKDKHTGSGRQRRKLKGIESHDLTEFYTESSRVANFTPVERSEEYRKQALEVANLAHLRHTTQPLIDPNQAEI